jgi:dynein heavy chain
MYLEGCKWNPKIGSLDESDPKILFVKAPMFWFQPCKLDEMKVYQNYEAPIYRTTERKGVLMTTGHLNPQRLS